MSATESGKLVLSQRLIDALGPLPDESLDDVVHDYKSREASAINNDGFAAQVAYLMKQGLSEDEIIAFAESGARDLEADLDEEDY